VKVLQKATSSAGAETKMRC